MDNLFSNYLMCKDLQRQLLLYRRNWAKQAKNKLEVIKDKNHFYHVKYQRSDRVLPCILPSLFLISTKYIRGRYKVKFQYVRQFTCHVGPLYSSKSEQGTKQQRMSAHWQREMGGQTWVPTEKTHPIQCAAHKYSAESLLCVASFLLFLWSQK